MTLRPLAVAGAVLLLSAVSASAVSLDFVAEASSNERGVADGTTIDNANTGNLAVTFSATGGSAYFDDLSGGKPAGLGVCTTLTTGAQCNPSDDDNITTGEAVFLKFEVDDGSGFLGGVLNSATFWNAGHTGTFDGTFDYSLDGGTTWIDSVALANNFDFGGVSFTADGIGFRFDETGGDEFYIGNLDVTPVPLPAGVWLMLAGLGGLACAGRSRART